GLGGSLGKRVGVMIQKYGFDASHRLLQFVPISFDASAEEIFPALASGAALVLHPDPTRTSPSELLLDCESRGVTALHIPAAPWHQIVEELVRLERKVPKWLRIFITGGESLKLERLVEWAERHEHEHESRFINAYGPTEATITSTTHELDLGAGRIRELKRLPIGKPVSNTSVYILDEEFEPAPVGVTGQIYIGGAGLARGYVNRPGPTAGGFVPDPHSAGPGARVDAAGDPGRGTPGGAVPDLGRGGN